jgi:hypothetical protein
MLMDQLDGSIRFIAPSMDRFDSSAKTLDHSLFVTAVIPPNARCGQVVSASHRPSEVSLSNLTGFVFVLVAIASLGIGP